MTIPNRAHITEIIGEDGDFNPGVLHIRPLIELHDQHAKDETECEMCTPTPGAEWWPWQHGNPLADVPPAEPWTPRRSS